MKNSNQKPIRYEWEPFPFGDGEQIFDIRYDPVFKAVFTKDTYESRCALSKLISALIGHTVVVETIIVNEPPIDDLRQKYLRFDVACKTEKGELVNVEMAFNPIASEPVRLEYYVSRLFAGQDLHGKDKKYDDLKETYQIAILANEKFYNDENFIHNFVYSDLENRISLGGRTKIITVELVKTEPAVGKPVEEMTNAELWAVFFQYLTDPEKRDKINKIINQEEGIAMAVDTLINITKDEEEFARMTTLIKSELDWRSGMADAENKGRSEGLIEGRSEGLIEGRSEGLIEGRSEGRNEANMENARKMKAMGLLSEQIQAVTGLSPEIIAKL